jgi:hypothetical protein
VNASGTRGRVDLILLTTGGEHFVVQTADGRIAPLCLDMPSGQDDLAEVVQRLASERFEMDIRYLGVLAANAHRLSVLAVLRDDSESTGTEPQRRMISLAELKARSDDVTDLYLYQDAWHWHQTQSIASDLAGRLRRAFDTSLVYLDNHVSAEGGRWGWNLYLDGSSIGLLSTAEGLLSHVHAGARGEFVSRPAETLEGMQNPDGGWQVRRSLVGGNSQLSITESTTACLWALHAAGRTASDPAVRQGIVWLEGMQQADGGWPSSGRASAAREPRSLVFPTTCAVRALARFGRTDAVTKGVAWLRGVQRPDGGWGEDVGAESSPAYAGYAVVTLLNAGVAAGDRAVERACEYLRKTFDLNREEPWASTAYSALVDPESSARLEYRHFGTPWALAALCQAGNDVGDRTVLLGLDRLLALQDREGAWRCGLTPGSTVMWASHDALYALRSVIDSSTRNLLPLAEHRFVERERVQARRDWARLLAEPALEKPARRDRTQRVWLSALTVAIVIIGLAQTDFFRQFHSNSVMHKVLAGLATILVTTLGALVPQLLNDEYYRRRNRGTVQSATRGTRLD